MSVRIPRAEEQFHYLKPIGNPNLPVAVATGLQDAAHYWHGRARPHPVGGLTLSLVGHCTLIPSRRYQVSLAIVPDTLEVKPESESPSLSVLTELLGSISRTWGAHQ